MADMHPQDNRWSDPVDDDMETVTSRNPWIWLGIPLLCVGVLIVACGGIIFSVFFGVTTVIKTSEPYRYALEQIDKHGGLTKTIGEPIQTGKFLSGSLNLTGDSGEADFVIPVSGPGGRAEVHVVASKSADRWTYTKLLVDFEDPLLVDLDLLE